MDALLAPCSLSSGKDNSQSSLEVLPFTHWKLDSANAVLKGSWLWQDFPVIGTQVSLLELTLAEMNG